VLLLIVALERASRRSPDVFADHAEACPELLGALGEDLELLGAFLGEGLLVIEEIADRLPAVRYLGRTPADCGGDLDASNWLYDTVQEAVVLRFDLDPDEVERGLREIDRIVAPLAALRGQR
ncbi:MAG: hypothetical protein OEY14_03185, partial [Myxococcales bacterium]|nr:hypothetical protein [Myxococcales bacterium]